MSASLSLARFMFGLTPKFLGNVQKMRASLSDRPAPVAAEIPATLRSSCRVEERVIHGQRVVTLIPRAGKRQVHVLYLHGGAYVNALIGAHWSIIRAVIEATGATVTVPMYALAPENDHIPGTTLIDLVFAEMMSTRREDQIVVMGDSAGGNAVLTLTLRRRDLGLPLPDLLILFSPWLDLAVKDPEARRLEGADIRLGVDALRACGKMWAGDVDPLSPHMSPLYADLQGMPSMGIFQGDRDIFVVDARNFVERATVAGVNVHYHEYPGGFHVFMGLTFLPEAKDVFRQVKALIGG